MKINRTVNRIKVFVPGLPSACINIWICITIFMLRCHCWRWRHRFVCSKWLSQSVFAVFRFHGKVELTLRFDFTPHVHTHTHANSHLWEATLRYRLSIVNQLKDVANRFLRNSYKKKRVFFRRFSVFDFVWRRQINRISAKTIRLTNEKWIRIVFEENVSEVKRVFSAEANLPRCFNPVRLFNAFKYNTLTQTGTHRTALIPKMH